MDSIRDKTAQDHHGVPVESIERHTGTPSHDVIQPENIDVIVNSDEHDHSGNFHNFSLFNFPYYISNLTNF